MNSYLCMSWQSLTQQIVTIIKKGYYWYQPITPKKSNFSEQKWLRADERIIEKFAINMTKDQRYYARKKGKANHIYLRYNSLAFLLRTKGEIPETLDTEVFYDIRDTPLYIVVSKNITLKIFKSQNEGHFTVYLARESYRALKAEFSEMIEHRKIRELEFRYSILNNIPSYNGINIQKRKLREHILKHAKRHGVIVNRQHFKVLVRRKIYQVFESVN